MVPRTLNFPKACTAVERAREFEKYSTGGTLIELSNPRNHEEANKQQVNRRGSRFSKRPKPIDCWKKKMLPALLRSSEELKEFRIKQG